jgi:uncharacterized membrane protein YfcA
MWGFREGPWTWARIFAQKHSTTMVIFTSAIVFIGGWQDHRRGEKNGAARIWGIWAMAILGFYSTSLFYNDDWLGLVCVFLALLVEMVLFAKLLGE